MEFFSFGNIIVYIDKFIKFINSIFFVILIIGISFALIISPVDYLQGDDVRIMYVHVPSEWIGLSIFSLIALTQATASSAPLAPKACPIIDFVELTLSFDE